MNDLLVWLGAEQVKPWVAAMLLPPAPFLLLALLGAWTLPRRRVAGWVLVLLGLTGVWLSCTQAVGALLTRGLLSPPPALTRAQVETLKRAPRTAIVVLGGGRRVYAPEYGMSTLHDRTAERLRYGVWLARETGLPLAFSGGVGFGAPAGPTEAEVAARVAEREYGLKLRWVEGAARDTRENGVRSIALLRPQGIDHVILVTHQAHMPRAIRNFEAAALAVAGGQAPMRVTPAPLRVRVGGAFSVGDWVPDADGLASTRLALHEWFGRLAGA